MAVDAWGFDSERQAKAHRLRRMRFRLSIVRSAAIIVLVVGLVAVGSASLRDAVASFRWTSWASTILFLVLLFLIFLAVELPFAYVGGHRWRPPPGSRHNPSGDGRRTSPSQWASASVARLLWEASSFGSFRRRPRGGGSWPGSSGSWCPRSWASSRQCSWSRSSIGSGPSLMPPYVVVSKPSRRRQKSQSWACSSCARPRRLGGRTPRSWVSVPRGG